MTQSPATAEIVEGRRTGDPEGGLARLGPGEGHG